MAEPSYNPAVAQPATRPELPDGELPIDPTAIERRYHLERARRRARERRKLETSLARTRFYAVMLVLGAGAIALLVLVWHEIQRLFGL
jgi:hypothetical protein